MARTLGFVDWKPDVDQAIAKVQAMFAEVAVEAVDESAAFVQGLETKESPDDTGALDRGLTIEEVTSRGGDAFPMRTVSETDADRVAVAFFVNKGTRTMAARPFADAAVKSEKRRFSRRVSKRVKARLAGDQ